MRNNQLEFEKCTKYSVVSDGRLQHQVATEFAGSLMKREEMLDGLRNVAKPTDGSTTPYITIAISSSPLIRRNYIYEKCIYIIILGIILRILIAIFKYVQVSIVPIPPKSQRINH